MNYTEKDKETLDYLKTYIDEFSMPPTMQEISDKFNYSKAAAKTHLVRLEQLSKIKLLPGRARGIKILEK